ncbi:hypothetical protein Tco_1490959, partial [Tanacetum coccineum]
TTNIDQLHAYLGQHEFHANEVRLMHERNSDPLALVATHQMTQSPYKTYTKTLNFNHKFHHISLHINQPDSDLIVPVFQTGDDPIDSINHMMSFLTAVVTSRYPTTNNQLRNSSNPRQQATINDGREQVEAILGNKGLLFVTTAKGKDTCPNSEQCTKPKRKRDDSWFQDKMLLVQAQANGQILHEEELAFLADPGIAEGQAHTTLEPKLYDGNVIKNTSTIVIPDSEETLMLAEEDVEQHRLESKTFEVKMHQVLNENERLLEQVINKDIVNIIMNSSVDNASVNVHECENCQKLETELINKEDFIEKEIYD